MNPFPPLQFIQTGGLLSDVFLHLVPHSFMGEHQGPGVHVVMVDDKRNIIIGYASLRPHTQILLRDGFFQKPSDFRRFRSLLRYGKDIPRPRR